MYIPEKVRELFSNGKLKEIINGRKILIWSACKKSDEVLKLFKDNKMEIDGYIDRDLSIKKYNGYNVYDKNIIKNGKYFVYVALEGHYKEILEIFRGGVTSNLSTSSTQTVFSNLKAKRNLKLMNTAICTATR